MLKRLWMQIVATIIVAGLFFTSIIFAVNNVSVHTATAKYTSNNQNLSNLDNEKLDEIFKEVVKNENSIETSNFSLDNTQVGAENVDDNSNSSIDNNSSNTTSSNGENSSNANNSGGSSSNSGSSNGGNTSSGGSSNGGNSNGGNSNGGNSNGGGSGGGSSNGNNSGGSSEQNLNGDFVFTTSGYGHGAGMSQRGADGYAKYGGWGYGSILSHYYPGTYLTNTYNSRENVLINTLSLKDNNLLTNMKKINEPTVWVNGTRESFIDLTYKNVQREMGDSFSDEALKAQAVAAYTYIVRNNGPGSLPLSPYPITDKVRRNVDAVAGQAVYYDGSIAETYYYAASPGQTNNSRDVWGGHRPYIVTVPSVYEGRLGDWHYADEYRISVGEVKQILNNYGITTSGDPTTWFQVLQTNTAGYALKMKIGDSTNYSGRDLREKILKVNGRIALRAPWFRDIRVER